jgi:hypothetical protein
VPLQRASRFRNGVFTQIVVEIRATFHYVRSEWRHRTSLSKQFILAGRHQLNTEELLLAAKLLLPNF